MTEHKVPFGVRFAIEQTGVDLASIKPEYDYVTQISYVCGPDGKKIPFVLAGATKVAHFQGTATVTEVRQEATDVDSADYDRPELKDSCLDTPFSTVLIGTMTATLYSTEGTDSDAPIGDPDKTDRKRFLSSMAYFPALLSTMTSTKVSLEGTDTDPGSDRNN